MKKEDFKNFGKVTALVVFAILILYTLRSLVPFIWELFSLVIKAMGFWIFLFVAYLVYKKKKK